MPAFAMVCDMARDVSRVIIDPFPIRVADRAVFSLEPRSRVQYRLEVEGSEAP